MRGLLLLVTIATYSGAFGQSDTLKSNEIEFGILNSKDKTIDNFDSDISIYINHAHVSKISKELVFTHGRENKRIYMITFKVKPSKVNDTITFSYPGTVLPKDKFYLNYDTTMIEYQINSTVNSNNTPYYMDFKFLFNGDTIKSSDYEISNFRNNRIDEATIRVMNFVNQKEVKVKYRGKTIKIDLLKGYSTTPIYHGLTLLGYITNFNKIEKNEYFSK